MNDAEAKKRALALATSQDRWLILVFEYGVEVLNHYKFVPNEPWEKE